MKWFRSRMGASYHNAKSGIYWFRWKMHIALSPLVFPSKTGLWKILLNILTIRGRWFNDLTDIAVWCVYLLRVVKLYIFAGVQVQSMRGNVTMFAKHCWVVQIANITSLSSRLLGECAFRQIDFSQNNSKPQWPPFWALPARTTPIRFPLKGSINKCLEHNKAAPRLLN